MSNEPNTHFGYEILKEHEKNHRVRAVFDSVAPRYDLMNDLMSFGLHHVWKQIAIQKMNIRPNQVILDLAGGTGDLSLLISKKLISNNLDKEGKLILADINASMLNTGRKRLIDAGFLKNIEYVQLNAEILPFPNDHFHSIVIGFGLRNVTRIREALKEMYRVLKPGGRVVILEFSHPTSSLLNTLYDIYSFSVLPLLGKWIQNDSQSYQYLAESIRMHPKQEELKAWMEAAAFERVQYQNLHGGIVAIHTGFKL